MTEQQRKELYKILDKLQYTMDYITSDAVYDIECLFFKNEYNVSNHSNFKIQDVTEIIHYDTFDRI